MADGVVRCGNAACAAAPEKEDRADKVGEVESADGERYNEPEGIGRADVDEAEEAGDGSGEGDGGNRDGGTRVYLYSLVRSVEFFWVRWCRIRRTCDDTELTLPRIRQPGRP